MESISLEEFKDFLKSGKLKLHPTQQKLCFPIVHRIFHKMKLGVQFENINVKDDLIINGHHRCACSILLNRTIDTNPWLGSTNIIVYKWTEVQVDKNDWESIEIIERHNLKDAVNSGLDINQFKI